MGVLVKCLSSLPRTLVEMSVNRQMAMPGKLGTTFANDCVAAVYVRIPVDYQRSLPSHFLALVRSITVSFMEVRR